MFFLFFLLIHLFFCESFGNENLRDVDTEKKKLVVIHSYVKGYYQVDFEDIGIYQGLSEQGFFEGINLEIDTYYMDCKGQRNTPEKQVQYAVDIRNELVLESKKPDAMIVCDDCAFKRFALDYVDTLDEYPVLFIGVGTDMDELNAEYDFFDIDLRPTKNMTGVSERYYIYESIRVMNYALLNLENTRIVFLSDNSSETPLSSIEDERKVIENRCKEEMNITFEVIYVQSIQEVGALLQRFKVDPKYSNVKAIGTMIWETTDEEGEEGARFLGTLEVVDYVLEKVKNDFLTISVNLGITRQGYLGGIVVDTVHMGELIGGYAGRILNEDASIRELQILGSPPTCSWYYTRFGDLGIEVENAQHLIDACYVYRDQLVDTTIEVVVEESFNSVNLLYLLFSLIPILLPIPYICECFFCLCSCICTSSCITVLILCYTSRLLRFKNRFNNVDIDDLMMELMASEYRDNNNIGFRGTPSGEMYGKVKQRAKGGFIGRDSIEARLIIKKEMFLIPYKQIKLKEVIGKGGQSVVFLAKWKGKRVAYKSFNSMMISNIEDFQVEASILTCLNHPNILKLFGIVLEKYSMSDERMRCGIVEEYCENKTLHNFIENRIYLEDPPKMSEKIPFLKSISEGLEYTHEKNIIHRDLKLKNVLLDRNNVIKIIDFGVSRISQNVKGKNSKTRNVGTSSYIAPEVYDGRYGVKVDIYSFGIIMWNLLLNKTEPEQKIYNETSKEYEIVEYSDVKAAMDPNYRPFVDHQNLESEYASEKNWYIKLMSDCWNHDPEKRPDFVEIIETIKENQKKKKKGKYLKNKINNIGTMRFEGMGNVLSSKSSSEENDNRNSKLYGLRNKTDLENQMRFVSEEMANNIMVDPSTGGFDGYVNSQENNQPVTLVDQTDLTDFDSGKYVKFVEEEDNQ